MLPACGVLKLVAWRASARPLPPFRAAAPPRCKPSGGARRSLPAGTACFDICNHKAARAGARGVAARAGGQGRPFGAAKQAVLQPRTACSAWPLWPLRNYVCARALANMPLAGGFNIKWLTPVWVACRCWGVASNFRVAGSRGGQPAGCLPPPGNIIMYRLRQPPAGGRQPAGERLPWRRLWLRGPAQECASAAGSVLIPNRSAKCLCWKGTRKHRRD